MLSEIEVTNGIRAWGFACLLFGAPKLYEFLCFAGHRARQACSGFSGSHIACARAFVAGAWQAGREAEFRVNTWVAVAVLLFAGLGGGSIFVSSNFLGGYSSDFLNAVMLVLWSMLSAAAWAVVIGARPTRRARREMALSSGVMLVVMLYAALNLEAQA